MAKGEKKVKPDTGDESYVGEKKQFDPAFSGPRGVKRKPRDVYCVFIFLIFWIGMVGVAFLGINLGNPYKYDRESDESCVYSAHSNTCQVDLWI